MLRGGCLCGAVRYRIDGPVFRMTHCHCSQCREAHGAAYATYVNANAADVRFEGVESIGRFASSPGVERAFCTRCGSPLSWVTDADGRRTIGLTAGTLRDDPGLRPERHLHVASRASWETLPDDGLPRHQASDRE